MGIRGRGGDGDHVFGLELVRWRGDLAVSVMEKRADKEGVRGRFIRFSINLPRGFDLEKRVKDWEDEWQNLPYISPYEDAFHLAPNSDQAEKWAVAVIHELLCLLVGKKTEMESVFCLGEYLGFGGRLKKAILHHPGIFYVSNKIRTQTVVLREAYTKNFLIEKHPLVSMRYKYIWLMNTVMRRGKPIRNIVNVRRHKVPPHVISRRGNEVERRCIDNDGFD
ncbi:hypothetical protein Leryth_020934 [Lithospermum erythrorhizon]|nr:hypothetical protein Leryth_020934 [Lithospermum erythrorhizon]